MAPVAVRRDLLGCVVRLINAHSVRAELDVPTSGSTDIEGNHLVVGVASERRRDGEAVLDDAIERLTDGVERIDLDHDVDEAGGATVRGGAQREAVVAFVHAEEPDAHRAELRGRGQPHRAAGQEAEDVGVEVERAARIHGRQHDVAESLIPCDEPGTEPGDDGTVVEDRSVEDLDGGTARVGERDR